MWPGELGPVPFICGVRAVEGSISPEHTCIFFTEPVSSCVVGPSVVHSTGTHLIGFCVRGALPGPGRPQGAKPTDPFPRGICFPVGDWKQSIGGDSGTGRGMWGSQVLQGPPRPLTSLGHWRVLTENWAVTDIFTGLHWPQF